MRARAAQAGVHAFHFVGAVEARVATLQDTLLVAPATYAREPQRSLHVSVPRAHNLQAVHVANVAAEDACVPGIPEPVADASPLAVVLDLDPSVVYLATA